MQRNTYAAKKKGTKMNKLIENRNVLVVHSLYYVKKSKRAGSTGKKLELKKYCKWCKKHTLHQELK